MPRTTVGDATLYYERNGRGETVVLVGDAGFGPWQWGWQAEPLAGWFETVVWDHRGVGQSPGPATDSVEAMVADLAAVLRTVDARRAHVVGAGLGGMVALEYVRQHSRAASLVLFNTAATGGAVDRDALAALHPVTDEPAAVRDSLTGAFGEGFLRTATDTVTRICEWRRAEDGDPATVRAHTEAMCSFEAGPLHELSVPTLVCHGVDDPVVAQAAGRDLAAGLPRGSFEPVEGRHLCFAEHARAVNDRLLGFLDQQSSDRGQ